MNQLTIDAHANGRAFFIDNTNTDISGLSVINASGEGFPDFLQAGAILNGNGGTLTLTDVKVADSTADATGTTGEVFAGGGGIYTSQGRLNLDHSIVTGNSVGATQTGTSAGDSAHARGGGIYALNSFVSIVDSTVSDNEATATSSGPDGADATAGIYTNDEVEMTRSTISGGVATATATGAGSAANAVGGLAGGLVGVTVQQSTIAANQADATGVASSNIAGGVLTTSDSTFISSTIALNGPTSLLTPVEGSNLVVDDGTGSTDLENTIISDPRGGGANCDIPSGSLTSSGFNDDFSPAGASCFSAPDTTDLTIDPLLDTGGLADNGGPTQTIALQLTSPVIDQGSNGLDAAPADPNQDQRGFLRPVDVSSVTNADNGTDIGAFEANPIVVNTTEDQTGSDPECSLREAIASANQDTAMGNGCADGQGTDTIIFDPTVFVPGGPQEQIDIGDNELFITAANGGLTITGPGADELSLNAGNARIFDVAGFTNPVTITGMKITGGNLEDPDGDQMGGGILNAGALTLTDVEVSGNGVLARALATTDVHARGGGIYNDTGGQLTLNNTTVSGNTAEARNLQTDDSTAFAEGGGIYNKGALHIHSSRIAGNDATARDDNGATSPAAQAIGGGLRSTLPFDADHTTFIDNKASATSFAGLGATARGGGIASSESAGLVLSTVAKNLTEVVANAGGAVKTQTGGGINHDGATNLDLTASTIAFNGPTDGSVVDGANLGTQSASFTMKNNIISDPVGGGKNCSASYASNGFNVDFSPAGASCDNTPMATDLTTDPKLAQPAANGGLGETIALGFGSSALDTGSSVGSGFSDDQRELTRPIDLATIANVASGDGSDVGAFEAQAAPTAPVNPTVTPPTTPLAVLAGSSGKLKKGSVGIPISCPAGGPACQGSVSLTGNVLLAVISTKKKIGSASFSIPAGQKQKVKVRLSKRAINTVQTKGKLVAKLTITSQGAGGAKTSTGKFKIKG
jgi:CSLREA domain-containing protein